MSDEHDRRQRDELERVQGEVKRLREALARPDGLHEAERARVAQLRAGRDQQRAKLDESRRQIAELEAQLAKAHADTRALQADLDAVSRSEAVAVDDAVLRLDPGPAKTGCMGALAVMGALLAWVVW